MIETKHKRMAEPDEDCQPTKRLFVPNEDSSEPCQMVVATRHPTENNECHKLELSWFGTTMCSSRTHRVGEETVSLYSLSHGNQSK